MCLNVRFTSGVDTRATVGLRFSRNWVFFGKNWNFKNFEIIWSHL